MEKLNANELNKISTAYDYLLKQLKISDKHKVSLEDRGFTPDDISKLKYKTFPIRRSGIVQNFIKELDPSGVPGFWCNANNNWQLAGKAGLLIPVRNRDGSIFGLKIRADDNQLRGKYLQLSSNPKSDSKGNVRYPHGTAARTAVHYPIVGDNTKIKTLRITEGELKADLSTLLSDVYTISIPGIAMWEWALAAIDDIKPTKILLAFDADKSKSVSTSTSPDAKPFAVAKALANLYIAIKERGYHVLIEHWAADEGKGIDDVLSAGFSDKITTLTNEKAHDFVAETLKDDMPLEWCYIIGTKRFINADTLQELDKEQFSDKYAPDFKKEKAHNKVLRHPGFPRVDFPVYEPGKEQILEKGKIRFFNLWKKCELEPKTGDIQPFLEHCEYMLPNELERNILYDFLAYNIQFPGKKIHWALLLQGIQGTGKSYFGEVMRLCLGEKNVSNPSNEAIHESFTGWQKSCQLVVIEELMARGRLELMNKLKPMITQGIAVIREMYKPPYEQPNRFNILIFTNHEDAIIIDETDRRYCVLYSKATPREPDYYKELWEWTAANAGGILSWLQSRDISAFNPHAHAPMTSGKAQLIQESMPPLLQWIKEGIDTETWPFHCDVVASSHLSSCLPIGLRGTHTNAITKTLKQAGAKPLKQVRLTAGNYARLMSIRSHEMLECAGDSVLIDKYEQWSMSREPGGSNPIEEARPL